MGKGDKTKERILEIALQTVKEKGLGGTSVNDLLIAAGVKKGTLYYHFPGKDDLCLAVLRRAKLRLLENVEKSFEGHGALEGVECFFKGSIKRLEAESCSGGCIFGNTALEMSDSNKRFSVFVKGVFSAWSAKIAGYLAKGVEAGEIRSDIKPKTLADTTISVLEGAVMRARVEKSSKPVKDGMKMALAFLKA